MIYGDLPLRELKRLGLEPSPRGNRHPAAAVRPDDHPGRAGGVPRSRPRAPHAPVDRHLGGAALAPERNPLWDGRASRTRSRTPGGSTGASRLAFTLEEEATAVRWIHDELGEDRPLPLAEAEAVVRGLSVAMHGDRHLVVPLLRLREFDEYTTTHSINVSVLAMALGEWLGMGARDVRAFGVAGLMHDLGKVRIPKEILNKAGKLSDDERTMMNTPSGGRRADHHRLGARPRPGRDRGVRAPHHDQRRGVSQRSDIPRECHRVEPAGPCVRRLRRPADQSPLSRRVGRRQACSPTSRSGRAPSSTAASPSAFVAMIREWEPSVSVLTPEEAVPEG